MSSALLAATLAATLGQFPIGGQSYTIPTGPVPGPVPYGAGAAGPYGFGSAGPEVGGPPPVTATGGQNGYEQLYPFDGHENWLHGHFQEMPSYGGHHFFRPYNYKHVLSQSQVAGGWGMSPTMPYSQDYFRRAQGLATSRDPRFSQAELTHPNDIARYRTLPTTPATNPAAPANLDRNYYGNIAPTAGDALPKSVDPAVQLLSAPGSDNLQEQIHRQALYLQALQEEQLRRVNPGPALRAP